MPSEADALIGLAEIAIAMAGFAAVVVLFSRRDSGTWLADHAERFNGMVAHALVGAGFALLPLLLGAFVSPPLLWKLGSALIGAQIAFHAVVILALATTRRFDKVAVVLGASAVVALQAANVAGLGFDGQISPYLIGVLWHLTHAGILFAWLVMVRKEDVERS